METMSSSETSVDFHGLHGFISQKTDIIITVYCENLKWSITRMFLTVFRAPAIEPYPEPA
jgi:hypothetical protein